MCTNGKDKTLLNADELDIKTNYAYIDNQSIYLISTNSIQKTTLSDSKKKSLYITQNSISDANILNNYIYFSEYSDLNGTTDKGRRLWKKEQ